jgi:nucleotide-binding universal stress UspA family protein
MDAKQDQTQTTVDIPSSDLTPLSPLEARRAEDEARHQAAVTGTELFQPQQRGKVEAEMRRISEQITREARERLRAVQAPPARDTLRAQVTDIDHVPEARLPRPISFRHVAVPLDGGTFAERALPYATAVAHMAGARLTLAHIDTIPSALDTLVSGAVSEAQPRQGEEIRTYLDALRNQLPLQRRHVQVAVQRAPSPAQGICVLEDQGLADLVVMSSHARHGIERVFLGDVADELLKAGRAPVLVVSPLVAHPSADALCFSHALVPLDGSLLSEQALGALGGLLVVSSDAEPTMREITLLTVVKRDVLIADGEAYLAALRQQVETEYPTQGIAIHTVTKVGDPAEIIAGVAPRGAITSDPALSADLLVLATHGRGGIGRWLLGSVASRVLSRTALPVLLVHPLSTEP